MKNIPPHCIDYSEGVIFLPKEYGLYYHGNNVGYVRLNRHGMFYQLTCRFQMKERSAFRLYVENEKGEIDLGQCVFYGQALGIERNMPVKHIGNGTLRFFVDTAVEGETFVSIADDQPFYRIEELLNARFTIQSGKKGILLDRRKADHATAM